MQVFAGAIDDLFLIAAVLSGLGVLAALLLLRSGPAPAAPAGSAPSPQAAAPPAATGEVTHQPYRTPSPATTADNSSRPRTANELVSAETDRPQISSITRDDQ